MSLRCVYVMRIYVCVYIYTHTYTCVLSYVTRMFTGVLNDLAMAEVRWIPTSWKIRSTVRGMIPEARGVAVSPHPAPPKIPLLRASWSAFDGIWGVLESSWGVDASILYCHGHVTLFLDLAL